MSKTFLFIIQVELLMIATISSGLTIAHWQYYPMLISILVYGWMNWREGVQSSREVHEKVMKEFFNNLRKEAEDSFTSSLEANFNFKMPNQAGEFTLQ